MRVFVACPVPLALDGLARDVASAIGGRAVAAGSHHVTLAFLGERDDASIRSLADSVAAAVAPHGAMEAATGELGAFPSARQARVAWLGVEAPGLSHLAHDIQQATLGAPERRQFRPHVTLARMRHARDARVALARPVPPQAFTLDEVVVLRSHLDAAGARYEVLATYQLRRT